MHKHTHTIKTKHKAKLYEQTYQNRKEKQNKAKNSREKTKLNMQTYRIFICTVFKAQTV